MCETPFFKGWCETFFFKAPVHCPANSRANCQERNSYIFRAGVNSSYPIKLRIELARDYDFSSRKYVLLFSSDFFFNPLG